MNDAHHLQRTQNILIVDDIPANLRLLVDTLDQHGYAVAVAQDGSEAITRAEFLQPDLILLDVMMPVMDGFEAAQHLKANERTRDIPIIFMTALADVEDKLAGFAAGGVDYVTKPFEIPEVVARINNQLALRAAQHAVQVANQRLQLEIEAHERLELAYQESEERYRTLVDMLPIAIIVHANERIAFANSAALRLTGSNAERSIVGSMTMEYVPQVFHEDLQLRLRQASDGKGEMQPMAMQVMTIDGKPIDVELSGAKIQYGGNYAVMLVIRDTTEQREHEAALKHQANHDLLTGLPNRTLLLDRLNQAIARARRHEGRLGVMFIDLDKFKYINDSLGHSAGDKLLCTVALRLAKCVRQCDTVARLGGDEFVLLVDGFDNEATLSALAQRVVPTLAAPIDLNGQEHCITCSIGIGIYPQDGADTEELLKRADIAMYRAKETGRNNYQFFTPQMQTRMDNQLNLEKLLKQAVHRNEFVLHYQPQVSLQTGRIVGMEALVRWQSPEFGLLWPNRFIPFAEESDLILSIGDWVLNEACRQANEWRQAGLPLVPIAVNVSGVQFSQKKIELQVQQILQQHHLNARFLELEITESASMRDPENTILWMQRLKEVGVSLAIDDFGTGYSNLSFLKRFPVNKLKIDKSFVRGLTSDPQDFAITTAVVRMARSLGLCVVAEGVETDGQLRLLAAESCDEIQGFYFSKPLPSDAAASILLNRTTLDANCVRRAKYERTVLILDDEPNVRTMFQLSLAIEGVRMLEAGSTAEAYEILANNEVGVVVSDQHLPEEDGVSFFSRIKKMYPRTIRILLTADDGSETLMNAINRGEIYRFIVKPWQHEHVASLVVEALERYER
jgi:diguanylate cyclase (GGDEF)-like protein/PAS domain S-box-containing protein